MMIEVIWIPVGVRAKVARLPIASNDSVMLGQALRVLSMGRTNAAPFAMSSKCNFDQILICDKSFFNFGVNKAAWQCQKKFESRESYFTCTVCAIVYLYSARASARAHTHIRYKTCVFNMFIGRMGNLKNRNSVDWEWIVLVVAAIGDGDERR